MEIIENFKVVLDFQVSVDEETGEITTKCVKKSIDKTGFKAEEPKRKSSTKSKAKKEESDTPLLTLEDNKYCLNTAAVQLMGIEYGCKLDIKYQKVGKTVVPVIADDEVWGTHSGNKTTKTFTVACRGSKNEELAKYGNVFTVIAHPDTAGLFILQSGLVNIEDEDPELEDIPSIEEELSLPIDEDLQSLIDSTDAQITEVSSSIFTL